MTAWPANIIRNRRAACVVFLLSLLCITALTSPQPADSKTKATVSPKSALISDEFELSVTGLKRKRTYLVNIVAKKSTIFDCGAGGTYQNGQLSKYTRKKSSSKGLLSMKLTPARALGTQWCKSSYKGTIKLAADKKKVATFSFKIVG